MDRAWETAAVPSHARIDERTWRIAMPTGIEFVPWTNAYILLDDGGRAHVVDPGVDGERALDRLLDALDTIGAAGLDGIVVTHVHPDHVGLAARLRAATGAPLLLGAAETSTTEPEWRDGAGRAAALETWGVPVDDRADLAAVAPADEHGRAPTADTALRDGDLLPIPGRVVRVLETPGHTPGHVCLHDVDRRRVLTGDHVLPRINPGVGLGGGFRTNPLAAYLDGLERIGALDDHEALPGHEHRFRGIGTRCAELRDHHLRRLAEVAAVLAAEPDASVWSIASRITWSAGRGGLRGFHLLSALAQTSMHADLARSERLATLLACRSGGAPPGDR
ncbi:glyoxylase-like metal-dependent hydrolase (beta-lactamase superfamily II) [Pseudoclavibacter chungangensis]|nr:MBL fold metallo-hydrolase [Pseudoclavibacter chungangensis]NYJ66826.1 glyoxylase-like metal-dependent hydrolase (beta-lactamase superfamily II) [Pseudoclavibacter chungangensis]